MKSNYLHLLDLNDYSVQVWNRVIELGSMIKKRPEKYSDRCVGKVMATLFYEPSTRTQMSFQAAMIRLGGSIIGFDNPATSSVAKGECLKDTAKIISSYSDIIVMRHPLEGSAKAAALTSDCPVINAGDGGHLHPTQTLTDLLTLYEEKGRLNDLTIGMCGDLKNGRTVHSLCKALSCYKGNRFILISTKKLGLPAYVKAEITKNGCEYTEVSSIDECIGGLDVLYMTRIQKERFSSEEEYLSQKDVYRLDTEKMKRAPSDMIVMHPLPRVDEIAPEVDDDRRALYFKQAEYGLYVRMALILTMLENQRPTQLLFGRTYPGVKCDNLRCITRTESYLPKSFKGCGDTLECEFCDTKQLLK